MSISYSLIVAMSENRVIGREGSLPWHLPADLKHFKETTMGHPIVMGRKNHEDIGRPLPGRQNIVLTRQNGYTADGCTVIHEPDQLEDVVPPNSEVMIIGGAEVYALFFPKVTRMYLTLVHAEIEGDAFFPAFGVGKWKETSRQFHAADEANAYDYTFVTMERAQK
ncbi:MAG TPA: dihydrofolate reductase [Mariprofundaceae bacterium]|nr:dihydrofolate reductase [Mariprofundaceae bacterium]